MAPSEEMGTSERRTSMRQSLQQDADEYDLEALGISDGFRFNPSQQQAPELEVSQVEVPLQPRQSLIQPHFYNTNTPPRPSSISKPKLAADNFALRHDGAMGSLPTVAAVTASSATQSNQQSSLLSRASSVSTVSTQSTVMRSESPYQGPSGPSFPYQMYPQNTRVARTMSVATTSTAAIRERPYDGPAGPTHPYGMYPQSISPDAPEAIPTAIPVGFPGLNNDYQRRIGPEGEEAADIIGPDGHTEQLPPYTQYPDDAIARKVRGGVPAPALAVGAGGLGLATRNPEFDSPREEVPSPLLRTDRYSMVSHGSSQQTTIVAREAAPEKPELKHWQKVAKRKVCGIVPIWVFFIMGLTLLLFVAILAGVLTALKPKHHNKNGPGPSSQPDSAGSTIVYSTVTTTFDAQATTVPSSFPTLPTGSYGVNLGSPEDTQTSCIYNSAQHYAWSCDVPPLQISINVTTNTTTSKNSAILYSAPNFMSWSYGTQPPVIDRVRTLDMVIDVENPQYGPAWFFQVPYNKLVVIHQDQLAFTTSSSGKREAYFDPYDIGRKSATAQPGDMPWFCYWNGTLLETFIYPNETSAAGAQAAGSSTSQATSVSSTPANSNPASSAPGSSEAWSTPTSFPTGPSRKRQVVPGQPFPTPPTSNPFPSGYPKIIKIEERRIPEGALTTPPYCVQMFIKEDGTFTPNTNGTDTPVQVVLNETDPTLSEMSQLRQNHIRNRGHADLTERGGSIPGDCSCVWMAS